MTDRSWLNADRLKAYAKLTLLLYAIVGIGALVYWWFSPAGATRFLVSDFAVFWIAAGFAKTGQGALAYLPELIQASMNLWAPQIRGHYGWFYPPAFLLLVTPLGWVPYGVAYLGFMVVSVAGYLRMMACILAGPLALWCLAAFPGLWINFLTGQNGLLTAAIAGAALLTVRQRPALAGLLCGLLVIKPHMALLFPLAFAATRAWVAIATAGISAVAFLGLSMALLGHDTWTGWLGSLGAARAIMESGGTAPLMPTVFSFMRLIQAPVPMAYAAQTLAFLASATVIWRVWQSEATFPLKAATLMTASLLATPYLFEYDLAWLGPAIAWAAPVSLKEGWFRGEREVFFVAWWLPLVSVPVAAFLRIQIGPWILMALLWMMARHAWPKQVTR